MQITFSEHGYAVGDRLLEGVMFDITVDFEAREVVDVKVQKKYEKYFDDLNTKKWLREVKEHAQYTVEDIFANMSEEDALEVLTDTNSDGTIEF